MSSFTWEGDFISCNFWRPFAEGKQRQLDQIVGMRSLSEGEGIGTGGKALARALSAAFSPATGVWIMVQVNPHHIHIVADDNNIRYVIAVAYADNSNVAGLYPSFDSVFYAYPDPTNLNTSVIRNEAYLTYPELDMEGFPIYAPSHVKHWWRTWEGEFAFHNYQDPAGPEIIRYKGIPYTCGFGTGSPPIDVDVTPKLASGKQYLVVVTYHFIYVGPIETDEKTTHNLPYLTGAPSSSRSDILITLFNYGQSVIGNDWVDEAGVYHETTIDIFESTDEFGEPFIDYTTSQETITNTYHPYVAIENPSVSKTTATGMPTTPEELYLGYPDVTGLYNTGLVNGVEYKVDDEVTVKIPLDGRMGVGFRYRCTKAGTATYTNMFKYTMDPAPEEPETVIIPPFTDTYLGRVYTEPHTQEDHVKNYENAAAYVYKRLWEALYPDTQGESLTRYKPNLESSFGRIHPHQSITAGTTDSAPDFSFVGFTNYMAPEEPRTIAGGMASKWMGKQYTIPPQMSIIPQSEAEGVDAVANDGDSALYGVIWAVGNWYNPFFEDDSEFYYLGYTFTSTVIREYGEADNTTYKKYHSGYDDNYLDHIPGFNTFALIKVTCDFSYNSPTSPNRSKSLEAYIQDQKTWYSDHGHTYPPEKEALTRRFFADDPPVSTVDIYFIVRGRYRYPVQYTSSTINPYNPYEARRFGYTGVKHLGYMTDHATQQVLPITMAMKSEHIEAVSGNIINGWGVSDAVVKFPARPDLNPQNFYYDTAKLDEIRDEIKTRDRYKSTPSATASANITHKTTSNLVETLSIGGIPSIDIEPGNNPEVFFQSGIYDSRPIPHTLDRVYTYLKEDGQSVVESFEESIELIAESISKADYDAGIICVTSVDLPLTSILDGTAKQTQELQFQHNRKVYIDGELIFESGRANWHKRYAIYRYSKTAPPVQIALFTAPLIYYNKDTKGYEVLGYVFSMSHDFVDLFPSQNYKIPGTTPSNDQNTFLFDSSGNMIDSIRLATYDEGGEVAGYIDEYIADIDFTDGSGSDFVISLGLYRTDKNDFPEK